MEINLYLSLTYNVALPFHNAKTTSSIFCPLPLSTSSFVTSASLIIEAVLYTLISFDLKRFSSMSNVDLVNTLS